MTRMLTCYARVRLLLPHYEGYYTTKGKLCQGVKGKKRRVKREERKVKKKSHTIVRLFFFCGRKDLRTEHVRLRRSARVCVSHFRLLSLLCKLRSFCTANATKQKKTARVFFYFAGERTYEPTTLARVRAKTTLARLRAK